MLAVNISGIPVRFSISEGPQKIRRHELAAGEAVDLPDAYCVRLQAPSGAQPSVIEKLTGAVPGISGATASVVPISDPAARAVYDAAQARGGPPRAAEPDVRVRRRE